jgi:hypothetical protein
MEHPRMSEAEVARRGDEVYEREIRPLVETAQNLGRIVSIDVETGAYELGDDVVVTARRILERRPDAAVWTRRIGYNAVYAVGGSLTRTGS